MVLALKGLRTMIPAFGAHISRTNLGIPLKPDVSTIHSEAQHRKLNGEVLLKRKTLNMTAKLNSGSSIETQELAVKSFGGFGFSFSRVSFSGVWETWKWRTSLRVGRSQCQQTITRRSAFSWPVFFTLVKWSVVDILRKDSLLEMSDFVCLCVLRKRCAGIRSGAEVPEMFTSPKSAVLCVTSQIPAVQPQFLSRRWHSCVFGHCHRGFFPKPEACLALDFRAGHCCLEYLRGLQIYHCWRSLHAHIRMNRWLHKVFNPICFSTKRSKLAW